LTEEVVQGFLGRFGRRFYRVPDSESRIKIVAGNEIVMAGLPVQSQGKAKGDVVVPFRRHTPVYSLEWL